MQYKKHKQFRYKDFDYSQNGFYFITICTKNHQKHFGDIIKLGSEYNPIYEMKLSEIGRIAEKYWLEISKHFPFVNLDEFTIMPNHLHGIIEIERIDNSKNETLPRSYNGKYPRMSGISPKPKSISTIIGSFKSVVTKYANNNDIDFAWQSRFYDHIIRNEKELNKIKKYIVENPAKWHLDKYNLNK